MGKSEKTISFLAFMGSRTDKKAGKEYTYPVLYPKKIDPKEQKKLDDALGKIVKIEIRKPKPKLPKLF